MTMHLQQLKHLLRQKPSARAVGGADSQLAGRVCVGVSDCCWCLCTKFCTIAFLNQENNLLYTSMLQDMDAIPSTQMFCASQCLPKQDKNVYETMKAVSEYMAFHYTPPSEYIAQAFCPMEHLDFPVRCAELCIKHKNQDVKSRALDIGCAVGRASFELAKAYEEVVAIDYSSAFVNVCQDLKAAGEMPYVLKTEGDLGESKIAKINPSIDRSRVMFSTGDAGNLGDIGQFGCVLAANLVCRMKEPAKFINSLQGLVVPGGIVIITAPYSWSEEFSSKEKWLGGFMKNDQEVRGSQTIKEMMLQHFVLLEELGMPFVIRETVNKYHWVVSHTTVWRKL